MRSYDEKNLRELLPGLDMPAFVRATAVTRVTVLRKHVAATRRTRPCTRPARARAPRRRVRSRTAARPLARAPDPDPHASPSGAP